MVAELQAIILAGGEGSRMFPLTEGLPKCLLPIANMPMIWYVVDYLQKSGVTDIIVVVQSNVASRITEILHNLFKNENDAVNFDVVSLPDEDDIGTADAIRLVKDKIKTDVLIASCDTLTNASLHRLVDVHRTYDASFTAMLTKRVQLPGETPKIVKKKPVDPNLGSRDFVAIDKEENRLLLLSNEADLESECLSFRKSTLKRYPHIKIDTELVDSHLYIMKKWLIDYLCNETKIENFKSDFVPHLLRKQFSKPKKNEKKINEFEEEEEEVTVKSVSKDIFTYCQSDELTEYLKDWSGYSGSCLKDKIKCHAYVADSFCLRINTLPSYLHINREIGKFKDTIAQGVDFQSNLPSTVSSQKVQIGNDCTVGKSINVGNNVTIKKSVIGEHCSVGSNVKISNCIIMDNVRISDGCTIQGSIICENAEIQQNCLLNNCQVSGGYAMKENSEVKNEAIVQEEMEFEE